MQIKEKIELKNKGEETKIKSNKINAKLTWKTAIDLDLYCFCREKKESGGFFNKLFNSNNDVQDKTIYYGSKGSSSFGPCILLDQDAGVGDKSGDNEENINFYKISKIQYALIAVNIFNKPNSNFALYDGKISVTDNDRSIEINLNDSTLGNWCVIALIDNSGSEAKIININKVMRNTPKLVDFIGR